MRCSLVLLDLLVSQTLQSLVRYPEVAGMPQAGKGSHVPLSCPCTPACPQKTCHFYGLVFCPFNKMDKITGASAGEQRREGTRPCHSKPSICQVAQPVLQAMPKAARNCSPAQLRQLQKTSSCVTYRDDTLSQVFVSFLNLKERGLDRGADGQENYSPPLLL